MKNLYLVSYRVRTRRYMGEADVSESKVRAVWAMDETEAEKSLRENVESGGSIYGVSHFVEVESVEQALGSPL